MTKIELQKLDDLRERKKFRLNMTATDLWHLEQLDKRAAEEEARRSKQPKQPALI